MAKAGMWKIPLVIGLILSFVAFILGWISFGVPDWHAFQRYNGSTREFFGLWAYCQEQTPSLGTVCQRWPTAETQLFNGSRPSFIRTSEGLITTGMILLSFGLFFGIVALILPFLAYLAAGLAFVAFLFLVIGLPIFGRQSNDLSAARGDATYNKRYGFWLMVPTIVLEFLSILFFLAAGILYKLFGFGNIMTRTSGTNMFGRQGMLGPGNELTGPRYGGATYGPNPGAFGSGGMVSPPYPYPALVGQEPPGLLSEYLTTRGPEPYGPSIVQRTPFSALPQPSITQAMSSQPVSNVTPAYLRVGEPVGPRFTPIINLTGQTLVGPLTRIT